MFGADLESIDREIGKFSQNSTIGLDGDMDQGEGHTNMKDMEGIMWINHSSMMGSVM